MTAPALKQKRIVIYVDKRRHKAYWAEARRRDVKLTELVREVMDQAVKETQQNG